MDVLFMGEIILPLHCPLQPLSFFNFYWQNFYLPNLVLILSCSNLTRSLCRSFVIAPGSLTTQHNVHLTIYVRLFLRTSSQHMCAGRGSLVTVHFNPSLKSSFTPA